MICCFSTFAFSQSQVNVEVVNALYPQTVYLQNVNNSYCDSSLNAKKTFIINPRENDFFRLALSDGNSLLLRPLNGENISVIFDADNIYNSKISGSPLSQKLFDTYCIMNDFNLKQKRAVDKIELERKKEIIKIINSNSSDISNLLLINYLNIEEDFDTFLKLKENLKNFSDNAAVEDFIKTVDAYQLLTVGNKLTLFDDFTNRNDALIVVWASYCLESVKLINNINLLNKKYPCLKIIAVSLDGNKSNFDNAKTLFCENTVHICDFKNWQSPYVDCLHLEDIPFFILLDKNSIIKQKGSFSDIIKFFPDKN